MKLFLLDVGIQTIDKLSIYDCFDAKRQIAFAFRQHCAMGIERRSGISKTKTQHKKRRRGRRRFRVIFKCVVVFIKLIYLSDVRRLRLGHVNMRVFFKIQTI